MFPNDTKVYRELSNIARDSEALYNLMSISYYPGHLNGNYALVPLRWLDTVFQGQYLPSLSINYVAINKDLEKLTPQLY